jgi:hypothetical protein
MSLASAHRFRFVCTLLTVAMVCCQAAAGTTVSCLNLGNCCAEAGSTRNSCCRTAHRDSGSTGVNCCCQRDHKRCQVACACGEHAPRPAIPHRSQSEVQPRQFAADADITCRPPLLSCSRSGLFMVASSAGLNPRAGVNAMLCVWLI